MCDSECNGACETNNQSLSDVDDHPVPVPLVEKNNDEHHHKHEDHHPHRHHHSIYPNSKHPLGPVTLRLLSDDQILRNSVEKD